MATGSRDPRKPMTCCKVKIRPGSTDWAPHPSVPPVALQGTAGGCRGGGAALEAGSRPSAQFYFISTHSFGRNNVIASPLGNTEFLCHGNVYPVQLGEFWLWGRIETCSKNGLVKRRLLCLERAQAAEADMPGSTPSLPRGALWASVSPSSKGNVGLLGQ